MTECRRHGSMPRVFTIPASAPFLPMLIEALMDDKLGLGFQAGARSAGAGRRDDLSADAPRLPAGAREFLDIVKADAAILPRLVPMNDVDEDEIVFAEAAAGDMNSAALELPEALRPRAPDRCSPS